MLTNVTLTNGINALWLRERYEILKFNYKNIENNKTSLAKWNNRKKILSSTDFIKMMKYRGYEEKYFSNVVNGVSAVDNEIFSENLLSSNWFTLYEEAIEILGRRDVSYKESMQSSYILRPFLILAESKLKDFFKKNNIQNSVNINVIPNVLGSLATQLVFISQKSIVLELNVSKLRNELSGESPEERYHSFFRLYQNKQRLVEFYNEYVSLTRLLSTSTEYFIKNTIELFESVICHQIEINRCFGIDIDDEIINVVHGQGDTHQKGRTVIRLEYSSGKIIIFKPRNLKVTQSYNEFINWINSKGKVLKMPTYKVLCFSDYTFEEFINKKACESEEDVKAYYIRYGQLIAIMHLLRGNDFHMENLIASGEFPYIVDLETIIQNRVKYELPNEAYYNARNQMLDLVSSTSLLPDSQKMSGVGKIDISALSGRAQKSPQKVEGLVNTQTDKLKFDLVDGEIPDANNIPNIQGQDVCYEKYREEIIFGFRQVSRLFLKYRDELLDKEKSILNKFNGLKIRVIVRPTAQYHNMLQSTYHPDYMRDSLSRESVLENIWAQPFSYKEIIKSEYEDLMVNDIPIFFNYTDTRDLIDSHGNIYKGFFEETGFERMRKNLLALNDYGIEKQVSVIRVSTGDYSQKKQKTTPIVRLKDYSNRLTNKTENILIEQAKAIGQEILKTAIIADNQKTISWLTVNPDVKQTWKIERIPGDFYDGLSGLVLFYFTLYKITNEIQYRELCDVLIRSANNRLAISDVNYSCVTGKTSLLYPLVQIVKEEPETEYKQYLNQIIDEGCVNLNEVNDYDWIKGSTSFIQIIMDIYSETKEKSYLDKSIYMGEHLIRNLSISERKLIGGFAHGASSIAYVLMKLGYLSGKSIFSQKAMELLKYDRSLYDVEEGGWLDARDEKIICREFWCHGSVGIGLSRIKLREFYQDSKLDYEIHSAIQSVLNSNYANEDTLCHGNIGKTELLLSMYELSNNKKWLEISRNIALTIINTGKFQSRSIEGFPAIGLFTGLSGVGYQLLRLAKPDKVPSVLTFS
ncbi:type 2 lanthipeptide synthetase LanM family protein [Bacillus thuringiensis]|uniref:type 2 lanthipeptide synthetase LanM family protein n=1 Tax=Bacillus thuringiensis TaxID=1428 RepID=UPI002D7ED14A|nr:type 2 lanthipeptide synthetase LanM family protein [Bacillus thuringiensis]MEB4818074.1 type 2 lanthipeptide synthetase LanM family protein [Bacillus thuringiensis]